MEFKALVVDDSETSFSTLKNALPGVDLTHVSNPKELLSKFNLADFDAFIVDVHLPYLSGKDVVDFIKRTDSPGKPIIAFSQDLSIQTKKEMFNLKVNDFLNPGMCPEEINLRFYNSIRNSGAEIIGNLIIKNHFQSFYLGDTELDLTKVEQQIISCLVQEVNYRSTVKSISTFIWGENYSKDSFNTHFSNLSKKLQNWNYKILRQRSSGLLKIVPWKS